MEGLAQSWLAQQCRIIQGVSHGVVMLGIPDQEALAPVACWPTGRSASPALLDAARSALTNQRGIVRRHRDTDRSPGTEPVDCVACPLLVKGRVIGIVAVEVAGHPDTSQRAVMQLLQWGSAWLEMLVEQQAAASQKPLVTVLETLTVCLEQTHFQAAATAVATELATRLSCNRVSIGFLQGRRMQVRAISHTARFAGNTNLLRCIAEVMDEAVDADAPVVIPGSDGPVQITRAHEVLAQQQGNGAICSIPLVDGQRAIGALTLERPADQPFDTATIELCRQLALLVGPALELKRRDDRWLPVKAAESLRGLLARLFGARHPGLKLVALMLVALTAFLAVSEGTYRVTADAVLEGRIQRSVVAPTEGFIATSGVHAGDVVHAGQLLGTLDDRDLRLEQQQWQSQKTQFAREYRNALAEHDRAQVAILGARREQASARLELVSAQLARMQILAPFDGVIVSGDLGQSLGAPVERGEVLFRIAPLEEYRLVLQVDERDIPAIANGQHGSVRLSGMPGEALTIRVENITPVSTSGPGGNTFQVEARLTDAPAQLRPGMEGIGKIDIGQRKRLWIWTHRMVDWLRLWAWSWSP